MEDSEKSLWVAKESKSRPGKVYYFHKKTGVSSWTCPYVQDVEAKSPSKTSVKRESGSYSSEPVRKLARLDHSASHSFNPPSNIGLSDKVGSIVSANVKSILPALPKSEKTCDAKLTFKVKCLSELQSSYPAENKTLDSLTKNTNYTSKKSSRKKRKKKKSNESSSESQNKHTPISLPNIFDSHLPDGEPKICKGSNESSKPLKVASQDASREINQQGPRNKLNLAESRLQNFLNSLSRKKKAPLNLPVPKETITIKQSPVPVSPVTKLSSTTVPENLLPPPLFQTKTTHTRSSEESPIQPKQTFQTNICQISPKERDEKFKPLNGEYGPAESRLRKLQTKLAVKNEAFVKCPTKPSSSLQGQISYPEPSHSTHPLILPSKQIPDENIKIGSNLELVSCAAFQIVNDINCKENKSEAMDIDIPECRVLDGINELRKSDFSEATLQPSFLDVVMDVEILPTEDCKPFCIILDTNVLLSNLKIVQGLRDLIIPGKGPVTLYLPWQVMQELDSIKDHGKSSLKPLARQAISFLHDNFSSNHPRVRGQKYCDAKKHDLHCPDDSILQACLDLKQQGCNVILFTNDKNFSNKALVNDIPAASKDELLLQLNKQQQMSSSCSRKIEPCLPDSKLLHQNSIAVGPNERGGSLADLVLCELKMSIEKYISEIVSTAMEKEYGKLWKKRTIIPPPWDAQDALKCLSQHWLPICGVSGGKIIRQNADRLVNFLSLKTKRYGVDLADLQEAIQVALELLKSLKKEYSSIVIDGRKHLEDILARSKGCEPMQGKENMPDGTPSDEAIVNTPNLSSGIPSMDRSFAVLSCFERAFNSVSELCALKDESAGDVTWRQRATDMLIAVRLMIQCMESLLSVSESDLNEEYPAIKILLQLIRADTDITDTDIINFCRIERTRNLLSNGLKQFQDFEMLLATSISM